MRDLETVLCRLHLHSQPRYPRFTLCPECHVDAPHEAIVVEAVVNYFSKPEFRELFIEAEYEIQMGSDNRRPDIVLLDKTGNFVAIAECKRVGYVNNGIVQLKSYLCATDTPFGIFANSTYPNDWEFYENLRQNRFKGIKRNQFEREVLSKRPIESIREEKYRLETDIEQLKRNNGKLIEGNRRKIEKHERLEQQINLLGVRKSGLEAEVAGLEQKKQEIQSTRQRAKRSWQYIAGILSVVLCICIAVLIVELSEKDGNEELANENQDFKKQLDEKNKQIQDDSRAIQQLKTEIETLNSEVSRLESKNKELLKENEEWPRLLPAPESPDKPRVPEDPSSLVSVALNINAASIEEFQVLPGIGPKRAQDIFEYREKHGNFTSVDDITKVQGIGETILEKLREHIRVE